MWHEARKQEKKLRDTMVDYRKRAERRRVHYEKMRGDPNQLLRIHGNKCKLHLDLSKGGAGTTMIPWQGDTANMISRYDVRIHMDYIPDYSKLPDHQLSREEKLEEGRCNYERYRSLVQNKFHGMSESEALARIEVEEMYPNTKNKDKGKQKSQAKAAIAYRYNEDSDSDDSQAKRDEQLLASYLGEDVEKEKAFSSESEYEVDMDVDEFEVGQVDKLNVMALEYGVPAGLFSKSLRAEKSHLEEQKLARLNDLEKSSLTGKKARRERKLLKERQLRTHMSTPPLYARRGSPTYEPYEPEDRELRSESSSRSSSPEVGKVEFITEFGGGATEPQQPDKKQHEQPSEKPPRRSQPHSSSSPSLSSHPSHSHRYSYHRQSRSRSRERGHNHSRRRSDHRSRSRSRSRERRKRRKYSRSRSQERQHSYRKKSRSRSPKSRRSHSRSPVPAKPHSPRSKRSHSRSPVPRSRSKSPPPHHQETKPSSSEQKMKTAGQPSSAAKTKNKAKLTPQERLKKRMQAQLSKQFKIDKKVQREKEEQKEADRMEREDELREQMRKLREIERVQWEKEHGECHGRQSRSPSPHGYHYHHGRQSACDYHVTIM